MKFNIELMKEIVFLIMKILIYTKLQIMTHFITHLLI
jgi:hypothetical protein